MGLSILCGLFVCIGRVGIGGIPGEHGGRLLVLWSVPQNTQAVVLA